MSDQPLKVVFEPKVYLVGRQQVDEAELDRFLADEGVERWSTDTEVGGEKLAEVSGRLCYMSFARPRPGGNSAYIGHILEVGHGSVTEHPVFNLILTGVDRSFTHELVRHRAGFGFCLAGDTVIYSGSQENGGYNGVKKRWTIRQLWDWANDPKRKGRLKLIKVRTFDGVKFVPAGIRAIAKTGVKPILRVTLADGKTIRCSADHLFLSDQRSESGELVWRRAGGLRPGDLLGTNGRPLGYKCSEETKTKLRDGKLGEKNHQWRGAAASAQAGRLRAQRLHPTAGRVCERCGAASPLERHHRDKDTLNNAAENIEILCSRCHQREHHLGREMTAKWSAVVSVVSDGVEETFDIEVDHPAHNFVANGVVTHNSQLSQRYVDASDTEFVVPPAFERAVLEAFRRIAQYPGRRLDDLRAYLAREATAQADPEIEHAMAGLLWLQHMENCREVYSELGRYGEVHLHAAVADKTLRRKKSREAARSALPGAAETKIFVTANVRALRHFLELRGSEHADAAIRVVALKLLEVLRREAPNLFGDYEIKDVPGVGPAVTTPHRKV